MKGIRILTVSSAMVAALFVLPTMAQTGGAVDSGSGATTSGSSTESGTMGGSDSTGSGTGMRSGGSSDMPGSGSTGLGGNASDLGSGAASGSTGATGSSDTDATGARDPMDSQLEREDRRREEQRRRDEQQRRSMERQGGGLLPSGWAAHPRVAACIANGDCSDVPKKTARVAGRFCTDGSSAQPIRGAYQRQVPAMSLSASAGPHEPRV